MRKAEERVGEDERSGGREFLPGSLLDTSNRSGRGGVERKGDGSIYRGHC